MKGTSVKIILAFLCMFPVAGLLFWILNELVILFRPYSETGTPYQLANFVWDGCLLIILVLSIFWLFRKLREWEVVR